MTAAKLAVWIVDAVYRVHWEPNKDWSDERPDDAFNGFHEQVEDLIRDLASDHAQDVVNLENHVDYGADYLVWQKQELDNELKQEDLIDLTMGSISWEDQEPKEAKTDGIAIWILDSIVTFTVEVVAYNKTAAIKYVDDFALSAAKVACCNGRVTLL